MINMDFSTILKSVGDWISSIFPLILQKISELGKGKLITLIILGTLFFFSLKITIKILKIVLLILIIVFFISVGFSWIIDLIK